MVYCDGLPALKNMYRTVAVFLCTLMGCPVKMIRLAMMRIGSGSRKVPMETSCGAENIDVSDSEHVSFSEKMGLP